MESDRSYFCRRAAQERSAAEQARSRKAREAHAQMAECYEARAQQQAQSAEVA